MQPQRVSKGMDHSKRIFPVYCGLRLYRLSSVRSSCIQCLPYLLRIGLHRISYHFPEPALTASLRPQPGPVLRLQRMGALCQAGDQGLIQRYCRCHPHPSGSAATVSYTHLADLISGNSEGSIWRFFLILIFVMAVFLIFLVNVYRFFNTGRRDVYKRQGLRRFWRLHSPEKGLFPYCRAETQMRMGSGAVPRRQQKYPWNRGKSISVR